MEEKERVMAAAVCVLVILLSAQRLPVADASSEFCQCYADRYKECRDYLNGQGCKAYCCERCVFPADGDFDRVCGGSGGEQAPFCSTEDIGDDTPTAEDYLSRRHGRAKAKHG